MLTPASYDRAELLAEQGLSNRLIQACQAEFAAGPPASADERWWQMLHGEGHHG